VLEQLRCQLGAAPADDLQVGGVGGRSHLPGIRPGPPTDAAGHDRALTGWTTRAPSGHTTMDMHTEGLKRHQAIAAPDRPQRWLLAHAHSRARRPRTGGLCCYEVMGWISRGGAVGRPAQDARSHL